MLMWRGLVVLSVAIYTAIALPATQKQPETCLFNDESRDMRIIHVFSCKMVNVTFERKSTKKHAVVTIEPRGASLTKESSSSEESSEEEQKMVLRLSELPQKVPKWEKMKSYRVYVYDLEFESEKETFENIFNQIGMDVQKVTDLEVSDCPGFGLIHLQNLNELWSLSVDGTFEGIDFENNIGQILPQLRILYLNHIELEVLPSIKGLKYLEEIQIECNLCKETPEKYFSDNQMLVTLTIIAPEMTLIGKDLCENLKKLENLYLDTSASEIPSLRECESLREFVIYSENEDESHSKMILPDLKGLKRLRSLNIENSGLETVPVDIIKANHHLYDINLADNLITEMPMKAFAHLANLQALDMSGNNITEFADTFIPESLIYLNIEGALLKTFLPTKFLPNLYVMQLSDNQIKGTFELKPFLENYPALYLFDLSNNFYSKVVLEGPFYGKEDAIEVDLSYNQIETVKIDKETVGSADFHDETRVDLDLTENPLKCDCNLRPFVEALRQEDSNIYLVADVKCVGKKGKTLKTIGLDEMTC